MSEGVVDLLEVVEIDPQPSHPGAKPPRTLELERDALVEGVAIRQTGQIVVHGHVRDSRFRGEAGLPRHTRPEVTVSQRSS